MTLMRFPNGHITGKCHSILTPKNPRKRYCSLKNSNIVHLIIYVNNVQAQRANQQNPLDIILDEKLNFKCHIDKVLTKSSIAVIKRLRNLLLRKSLISIYKAIIRLHLHNGDILYDQPNNATFSQKIESAQFKAALAVTLVCPISPIVELFVYLKHQPFCCPKVRNFRLLIQQNAQLQFFRKEFGLVSPLHFVHDFSRKMLLMLLSVTWPNFIIWLPLLL